MSVESFKAEIRADLEERFQRRLWTEKPDPEPAVRAILCTRGGRAPSERDLELVADLGRALAWGEALLGLCVLLSGEEVGAVALRLGRGAGWSAPRFPRARPRASR